MNDLVVEERMERSAAKLDDLRDLAEDEGWEVHQDDGEPYAFTAKKRLVGSTVLIEFDLDEEGRLDVVKTVTGNTNARAIAQAWLEDK